MTLEKNTAYQSRFEDLPRVMWIYRFETKETSLTAECLKNIEHYAKMGRFELKIVDGGNYHQFLSDEAAHELDSFL